MNGPSGSPAEQQVRHALEKMLRDSGESGTRPSVLALARRHGMSNTAFRRRYPGIVAEVTAAWSAAPAQENPSGPSAFDRLMARSSRLKRDNRELRAQRNLAAAHIQRLAVDNARLRMALEDSASVTRLPRVPARPGG